MAFPSSYTFHVDKGLPELDQARGEHGPPWVPHGPHAVLDRTQELSAPHANGAAVRRESQKVKGERERAGCR